VQPAQVCTFYWSCRVAEMCSVCGSISWFLLLGLSHLWHLNRINASEGQRGIRLKRTKPRVHPDASRSAGEHTAAELHSQESGPRHRHGSRKRKDRQMNGCHADRTVCIKYLLWIVQCHSSEQRVPRCAWNSYIASSCDVCEHRGMCILHKYTKFKLFTFKNLNVAI